MAQPRLGRVRSVHRAADPRDALPHPRADTVLPHAVDQRKANCFRQPHLDPLRTAFIKNLFLYRKLGSSPR